MKNISWLVSYPKSGNTWIRFFLTNYLQKSYGPIHTEQIQSISVANNSIDFEKYTGLNPFELTDDEVDLYKPYVYGGISEDFLVEKEYCFKKVHDTYSLNKNGIPIFPENYSKCALYLIRNPLDVCTSYANHCSTDIQNIIGFLLNENAVISKKGLQLRQTLTSWQGHVQSWKNQNLIPIHFVRYEDMLQKPLETFGAVVRFLDLEYDEKRLQRAIGQSDFKLLQQMEQEKGFGEKMQLCKSFFWKGRIGNYRDFLSQEQIDRIVSYNCDTMKEFGYIDENGELTV